MRFADLNPFTPFHELYRHRSLLAQFSQRAVEARHRASMLGLFWMVVTPLLSLAIYTFVFGYIWEGRFTSDPKETNLDYALGIFLGLILFNFLSEVLAQSPGVIVSQPNFVKKVVFPLEILPAANVGAAAVSASFSLVLALVGVVAAGPGLDWHVLWLGALLPPVILIGFGSAWFFSAVGVFFRDVGSAMQFIVQILVYTSAVFYPTTQLQKIPAWAQQTLLANPFLHAVEQTRRTVLWHQPMDLHSLLYLWLCALAIFLVGYLTFSKLRGAFADVI